jgi:protein O-GlcNAc transferase
VTIESRSAWEDRAEAGKLAVVPLAILSDRSGGHYGPSSAGKPFGDVFRLPVLPDWLTGLRDRVLNGYKAPVSLRRTTRIPKVLYLSRQGSGRQLAPNDHQRLVDSLKELQLEGLADVEVTTFSSAMSFQDQVAKVSTSDVSLRLVV